jgi:hypothetical protein
MIKIFLYVTKRIHNKIFVQIFLFSFICFNINIYSSTETENFLNSNDIFKYNNYQNSNSFDIEKIPSKIKEIFSYSPLSSTFSSIKDSYIDTSLNEFLTIGATTTIFNLMMNKKNKEGFDYFNGSSYFNAIGKTFSNITNAPMNIFQQTSLGKKISNKHKNWNTAIKYGAQFVIPGLTVKTIGNLIYKARKIPSFLENQSQYFFRDFIDSPSNISNISLATGGITAAGTAFYNFKKMEDDPNLHIGRLSWTLPSLSNLSVSFGLINLISNWASGKPFSFFPLKMIASGLGVGLINYFGSMYKNSLLTILPMNGDNRSGLERLYDNLNFRETSFSGGIFSDIKNIKKSKDFIKQYEKSYEKIINYLNNNDYKSIINGTKDAQILQIDNQVLAQLNINRNDFLDHIRNHNIQVTVNNNITIINRGGPQKFDNYHAVNNIIYNNEKYPYLYKQTIDEKNYLYINDDFLNKNKARQEHILQTIANTFLLYKNDLFIQKGDLAPPYQDNPPNNPLLNRNLNDPIPKNLISLKITKENELSIKKNNIDRNKYGGIVFDITCSNLILDFLNNKLSNNNGNFNLNTIINEIKTYRNNCYGCITNKNEKNNFYNKYKFLINCVYGYISSIFYLSMLYHFSQDQGQAVFNDNIAPGVLYLPFNVYSNINNKQLIKDIINCLLYLMFEFEILLISNTFNPLNAIEDCRYLYNKYVKTDPQTGDLNNEHQKEQRTIGEIRSSKFNNQISQTFKNLILKPAASGLIVGALTNIIEKTIEKTELNKIKNNLKNNDFFRQNINENLNQYNTLQTKLLNEAYENELNNFLKNEWNNPLYIEYNNTKKEITEKNEALNEITKNTIMSEDLKSQSINNIKEYIKNKNNELENIKKNILNYIINNNKLNNNSTEKNYFLNPFAYLSDYSDKIFGTIKTTEEKIDDKLKIINTGNNFAKLEELINKIKENIISFEELNSLFNLINKIENILKKEDLYKNLYFENGQTLENLFNELNINIETIKDNKIYKNNNKSKELIYNFYTIQNEKENTIKILKSLETINNIIDSIFDKLKNKDMIKYLNNIISKNPESIKKTSVINDYNKKQNNELTNFYINEINVSKPILIKNEINNFKMYLYNDNIKKTFNIDQYMNNMIKQLKYLMNKYKKLFIESDKNYFKKEIQNLFEKYNLEITDIENKDISIYLNLLDNKFDTYLTSENIQTLTEKLPDKINEIFNAIRNIEIKIDNKIESEENKKEKTIKETIIQEKLKKEKNETINEAKKLYNNFEKLNNEKNTILKYIKNNYNSLNKNDIDEKIKKQIETYNNKIEESKTLKKSIKEIEQKISNLEINSDDKLENFKLEDHAEYSNYNQAFKNIIYYSDSNDIDFQKLKQSIKTEQEKQQQKEQEKQELTIKNNINNLIEKKIKLLNKIKYLINEISKISNYKDYKSKNIEASNIKNYYSNIETEYKETEITFEMLKKQSKDKEINKKEISKEFDIIEKYNKNYKEKLEQIINIESILNQIEEFEKNSNIKIGKDALEFNMEELIKEKNNIIDEISNNKNNKDRDFFLDKIDKYNDQNSYFETYKKQIEKLNKDIKLIELLIKKLKENKSLIKIPSFIEDFFDTTKVDQKNKIELLLIENKKLDEKMKKLMEEINKKGLSLGSLKKGWTPLNMTYEENLEKLKKIKIKN